MIHAGLELARRLESAEALHGAAAVEAQQRIDRGVGAALLEVAGGLAIFAGDGSPLTHAVGLGMRGPVSSGELDRMEDFYRERGAAISVEFCPLADPSLVELFAERGYRLTEFNNMLVRSLLGAQPAVDPPPTSRRAPCNPKRSTSGHSP